MRVKKIAVYDRNADDLAITAAAVREYCSNERLAMKKNIRKMRVVAGSKILLLSMPTK